MWAAALQAVQEGWAGRVTFIKPLSSASIWGFSSLTAPGTEELQLATAGSPVGVGMGLDSKLAVALPSWNATCLHLGCKL